MLRHQFGQDLVLGLDLLLQIGDSLLLGGMAGPAFWLEGGGPVLKELFLPAVEDRRLQSKFVAQIGPSAGGAASKWLLSLQLCNACVVFSRVPSIILTAEHSLHFQLGRNMPWGSMTDTLVSAPLRLIRDTAWRSKARTCERPSANGGFVTRAACFVRKVINASLFDLVRDEVFNRSTALATKT